MLNVTTLQSAPRRAGFTLIEVIVAVAIMILMAAVILPSVIRAVDKARVDDGVNELQKISAGITDFENDISEHPHRLTHLTTPITGSMRDICNQAYNGTETGNWDGPYFDRLVAASGLPISIGLAQDSFPGTTTTLTIVVNNVTVADAIDVDAALDGDGVSTTGGVRWGAGDPVVLQYVVNSAC